MSIIYLVKNNINNREYIGQTTLSLNHRKWLHEHCKDKRTTYFHSALKKYGITNFTWLILDNCKNNEELSQKEQYYIKSRKINYNSFRSAIYNWGHYDKKRYVLVRKELIK